MSGPSEWFPLGPQRFVDKRSRLTRDHGLVHYAVGAYRGGVMRRDENGKREVEHCPHAHNKASAARRCAEQAARRWNREERVQKVV